MHVRTELEKETKETRYMLKIQKAYYFIVSVSFSGHCSLILHWQPATSPTNQFQFYCKRSLHILQKTNIAFDSYLEHLCILSPCMQYRSRYCYFYYRNWFCYFNFYKTNMNMTILLYLDLLKFTLLHYIFQFNGTTYRQICVLGICMGTKV